jgi:putative MFS transporter
MSEASQWKPTSASLADRIDTASATSFHRLLFLILLGAVVADAMANSVLGVVLAPLAGEFQLSNTLAGALASVKFAGMALGGSVAGLVSDRLGRRPVFGASMVVWGAAALVTSVSHSLPLLIGSLFIGGFGMGAELPIAVTLLLELLPARGRGRHAAWLQAGAPASTALVAAIALVLMPVFGWRSLYAVLTVLAVGTFLIRRTVPESPRWHLARGELTKAREVLRRLSPGDSGSSTGGMQAELARPVRYRELFIRRYRRATLMTFGSWFCMMTATYGIVTWAAKILVDRGISITASLTVVLGISIAGIAGSLCGGSIDRWGRKPVIVAAALITAPCCLLYGDTSDQFSAMLAGAAMNFCGNIAAAGLYAYTPHRVRGGPLWRHHRPHGRARDARPHDDGPGVRDIWWRVRPRCGACGAARNRNPRQPHRLNS